MKRSGTKPILIFTRMQHHSHHSGYDQLARFVDCTARERNVIYRMLNLCPEHVLARVRSSAGKWYNSHALKQELQNIFDFIIKSNTVFHFLYGEDGFHYSGYLNRKKSNKIVATFHMPPDKFMRITESTKHLKKLDAAVIIAPNQRPLFNDIVGEEKVYLIPHGVNTGFFRPISSIKTNDKQCLFVGSHLRDFRMLKQVFQEINKKDPSASLIAVTDKSNFHHLEDLRSVHLHSSITEEDLISLYNSSGLFLLPLTGCTACNSALEAMACGLPVVSTKSGGMDMYTDRKGAVLIEQGDTDEMVQQCLEIINTPKLRQTMSSNVQNRAKLFDWTIIAEKMRALYAKLQQEQ